MALIGLNSLYYVKLTSDDETGVVYDTDVKRMAKAIEANIKPNVSSDTLYADDGPAEVNETMGEIEVELNVDDLSTEVYADLLGKTVNTDGVVEDSSDDRAPYVAIAFRSPHSKGGDQYVWLYKGKFTQPEEARKTKGESLEYQTPTIVGKFVKRDFDNKWRAIANSTDEGIDQTKIDNWFKEVYTETVTGA